MVNRRSISAALEMSPEKKAFIQGGPPTGQVTSSSAELEQPAAPQVSAQAAQPMEPAVASPPISHRSRRRRQLRAPMPQGEDVMLGIANLLVPLTTRLQPTTAVALKRAGLEQKLRGESPGTVQEIAEEAIQQWLRNFGYLA